MASYAKCFHKYLLILILPFFWGCVRGPSFYKQNEGLLEGFYHKVKQGQTLWQISRLYELDLKTLCRWNKMSSKRTIYNDQLIFIPRSVKKKKWRNRSYQEKSFWKSRGAFSFPIKGSFIQCKQFLKENGLNIQTKPENLVFASRSGSVSFSGNIMGMGGVVLIDHDSGYTTVYGYLKDLFVKVNDEVSQGQKIGCLSKIRGKQNSVLRFEIRKNGILLSPVQFFH